MRRPLRAQPYHIAEQWDLWTLSLLFIAALCCELPVSARADVLPVPCTVPPLGTAAEPFIMMSNNTYTLHNCTQTVLLAVNGSSGGVLADVEVYVHGGVAFPFVRLSDSAGLQVRRFLLLIQGVNRSAAQGGSTTNATQHVGSILEVDATANVDGLAVHIADSNVHALLNAQSLVHVRSATLQGAILLNVSRTTMVVPEAWASLLLIATLQTAVSGNTMITVDVVDSVLSMRTTASARYLILISGMLFPPPPLVDSFLSIRTRHCSMAIVVDAMQATSTTYVANAAVLVYIINPLVADTTMPSIVRGLDIAMTNITCSIVALRPAAVAVTADAYVVVMYVDWDLFGSIGGSLGRATIAIGGGEVRLHGSRKTALVCFDRIGEKGPVHHVQVTAYDLHLHQAANGTIDPSSGAVVCSVCYVMDPLMPIAESEFRFRNITAWHLVQTGPMPTSSGTLPVSDASLYSSEFFMLWSTLSLVNISIDACVLYADLRNGTVPFSSKVPFGIGASISASFVRMRQGMVNATNFTLGIRDGIVVARMGFHLTPGLLAAIVSSHVTAALLVGNCSQCQITIEDVAVQILAMDFPKPPALSDHVQTQDLARFVNVFNFTGILQLFDVAPLFQAMPSMQDAYGIINPNRYEATQIWIRRTAVWYPTAVRPSGGDCLMVVGVANDVRNVSVVVEGGVPQFSSAVAATVDPRGDLAAGERTVVAPLHAMMTFVVADIADATFSFSGFQEEQEEPDVALGNATTLLSLFSGGFSTSANARTSLLRCNFSFVANTVAENLWYTVAPTRTPLWVYGGETSRMAAEGTTVFIANCSFAGFVGGGLVGANTEWVVPPLPPPTRHGAYDVQPALQLGCNLWDHMPLNAADNIGPVWRYLVQYPRSAYNGSIVCSGWMPTSTATASLEPPPPQTLLESLVPASVRATAAAATIASFASLQASGVRGSMPALQAAVGGLRAWHRCALAQKESTSAGSGARDDDEAYVAADWMENPFAMRVDSAVVPPVLAYAVGAVVGNTILVVVFAVAMHCLAVARRRLQMPVGQASMTVSPSSLHSLLQFLGHHFLPDAAYLPGTATASYAILLEPTITAGVALIGHYTATSVSVAVGALFLGIWVGVLVAFVVRMLQHGGLDRDAFVVKCTPSTALRRRRSSGPQRHSFMLHLRRWLEPSAIWDIKKPARRTMVGGGSSDAMVQVRYTFLENYGGLFDVYRAGCHLYFVGEMASAIVNGIVVGSALSVEPAAACGAAERTGWVLVAIASLQLAAYVVVRPFITQVDNVVVVVSTMLALSVHACVLAQQSGDGGGEDSGAAADSVMMAAGVFQIAPLLLAVVGAVLFDIQRRGQSHRRLLSVSDARTEGCATHAVPEDRLDTVSRWQDAGVSAKSSRVPPDASRRHHLIDIRLGVDLSDNIEDYLMVPSPPAPPLVPDVAPAQSLEALISMICLQQR